MPPRIKFKYDDIVDKAIDIAREQGAEAINARSVAAKLNCSIQPIFRTFGTMEELKIAVYKRAEEIYHTAMMTALRSGGNGFFEMGLTYLNFAKTEKNLFRLLFMSDAFGQGSAADIAGSTTGDDEVIDIISGMTGLDASKSQELYTGLWFATHGMASLLATSGCVLSEAEARRVLKMTYEGLKYSLAKEGGNHE